MSMLGLVNIITKCTLFQIRVNQYGTIANAPQNVQVVVHQSHVSRAELATRTPKLE